MEGFLTMNAGYRKKEWIISLLLLGSLNSLAESNLIVNGDFEAGNIGFSTSYNYYTVAY